MNKDGLLLESLYHDIVADEYLENITVEQIFQEGAKILNGSLMLEYGYGSLSGLNNPRLQNQMTKTVVGAGQRMAELPAEAMSDGMDMIAQAGEVALSTAVKGGVGTVLGGGIAQALAWTLHKSVEKILRNHEKAKALATASDEFEYSVKEKDWMERIKDGKDVPDEEIRQAKEDLLKAIEDKTEHLNVGKKTLATIVDRVADAIGSRYGSGAFALCGSILAFIYLPSLLPLLGLSAGAVGATVAASTTADAAGAIVSAL